MTAIQRVCAAWPAEGFAAAVGVDIDADTMFWLIKNQNKVPLASGWRLVSLAWHRSRKKDEIPDVTVGFGYGGALLFARSLLPKMFPVPTRELEFLSAQIDGEDGVLLNCLRVTEAIDRVSSDLQMLEVEGSAPSIFDVRWINITDRRALQWEVFCIPNSSDPAASRRVFVTDVFIDRYRSLGLRGLEFKHVGYIVQDASQAVPKPPAPPPPAPSTPKYKAPKLTAGALSAAERRKLERAGAELQARLQLANDAGAELILKRLTEEMQALRSIWPTLNMERQIQVLLGFSAIYGELLCSACGWSWATLRQGRDLSWNAVLAPAHTHVLALPPYLREQIEAEVPTVILMFNMIAKGNLPPAEPGQLMTIS